MRLYKYVLIITILLSAGLILGCVKVTQKLKATEIENADFQIETEQYYLELDKLPGLPIKCVIKDISQIELSVDNGQILFWDKSSGKITPKGKNIVIENGGIFYWTPVTTDYLPEDPAEISKSALIKLKFKKASGEILHGQIAIETTTVNNWQYYVARVERQDENTKKEQPEEASNEVNLSKDWISGNSAEFELLFKRYAKEKGIPESSMNIFEFLNVTPKAVFEETKCQIFKDRSSCQAFLLYDGNLYTLGDWFGGLGIIDVKTCDFNNDGKKDLLYSYSWGSGIHRSEIGHFNLSSKTEERVQLPGKDQSDFIQEEIIFEKISESDFKVYKAHVKSALFSKELIMEKDSLLGEIKSVQNKPVIFIK